MSILLFAGFFILYTSIFGRHLKPDAGKAAAPTPVLTALVAAAPDAPVEPPKPAPKPAAAKAVKPTVLVVVEQPLAAPTVANPEGEDAKPTKLVPMRQWATRHGITRGRAK